MDLALLSALFCAFSLGLYVLLDGFDLGVGALLLLEADESARDQMVDSILPTWDGNETWLIMAGIVLFAAFPLAYGVLLPAFYLPLIIMLLSLGLRGVSFEFRFQSDGARRPWDVAFALGSILAALAQGLIVGGLVQGVVVKGSAFGGGVLDVFRPFALLTAFSVLAGYAVLGAGWLHLKATGALRQFAERRLRLATPIFLVLSAAVCWDATTVQPEVRMAWATRTAPLAIVSALFVILAGLLLSSIGGRADGRPFALGLGMFGLGILGLGLTIFPFVTPFGLDLWTAAAPPATQAFLLIGAVLVTPVVLAYSAFAYHVFRGKTPVEGWEA
jgi:cytochrome d ubiquinol oxidase subunit II